MRKNQKGLQLVQSANTVIASLYGTNVGVLDRAAATLALSCGGFHTRSTVKALNTFLVEAGIPGRAYLLRGHVHVDLSGLALQLALDPSVCLPLGGKAVSSGY